MKCQSGRGFREKFYLWGINTIPSWILIPLTRSDRIVAILIQLQSKRIVRAQELADRFGVSLRTIYRDIRTLEASGVPLLSEAGVGYSIMDGYRLPPVTFTREEAGSFVAAEKLMQTFTDQSLGAYHQSAMYKVKSVLRGTEKDWVATLESHVRIDPSQRLFNEDVPDALEILLESIAERKQVRLHYQSLWAKAPSERSIEPVGRSTRTTTGTCWATATPEAATGSFAPTACSASVVRTVRLPERTLPWTNTGGENVIGQPRWSEYGWISR